MFDSIQILLLAVTVSEWFWRGGWFAFVVAIAAIIATVFLADAQRRKALADAEKVRAMQRKSAEAFAEDPEACKDFLFAVFARHCNRNILMSLRSNMERYYNSPQMIPLWSPFCGELKEAHEMMGLVIPRTVEHIANDRGDPLRLLEAMLGLRRRLISLQSEPFLVDDALKRSVEQNPDAVRTFLDAIQRWTQTAKEEVTRCLETVEAPILVSEMDDPGIWHQKRKDLERARQNVTDLEEDREFMESLVLRR